MLFRLRMYSLVAFGQFCELLSPLVDQSGRCCGHLWPSVFPETSHRLPTPRANHDIQIHVYLCESFQCLDHLHLVFTIVFDCLQNFQDCRLGRCIEIQFIAVSFQFFDSFPGTSSFIGTFLFHPLDLLVQLLRALHGVAVVL